MIQYPIRSSRSIRTLRNVSRSDRSIVPIIILLCFTGSLAGQNSETNRRDLEPKKYGPKVVAKAETILADLQLRRSGKSIQSTATTEISRAISGLTRKKRELRLVQQEWQSFAERIAAIRQEQKRLNAQYGELNLKLARVAGVNTAANNQVVGLINATVAQMKALTSQRNQLKEQLIQKRAALNQAESEYAETILTIRSDFDSVRKAVEVSLSDNQAKIAFRVMHANFQTPEQPSVGTILRLLDKRIERLEQQVFSESIKLSVDGRSLYVNVVIGKKTTRMVVDSGATMISLPRRIASDLEIVVPSDAPVVRLVLADGRSIPAHRVAIPKVRVGEFEALNVDAAILDVSTPEAEPLLGMSFLGNFKFEIDTADKTLKLLRVESE